MGKLKLDVDAIRVESFATGGGEELRGTVKGKATGEYGTCDCTLDFNVDGCGGGTIGGGGTNFCPVRPSTDCTYVPSNTCQTCGIGSCDITCKTCYGQATCYGNTCHSCQVSCDTCAEPSCVMAC